MDTPDIETLCADAIPDTRYDDVVKLILRDKQNRWNYNYFVHAEKTGWDVAVARSKVAISDCENVLVAQEALLTKTENMIVASRLNPTEKGYVKLGKKELANLDSNYVNATDAINEARCKLSELCPRLEEEKWRQYAGRVLNVHILTIRNRFKLNGDLDLLRRGITWAMTHYYKLTRQSPPPLPDSDSVDAW